MDKAALKITQAEGFQDDKVIICLSDDRTFIVTLEQLLSLNPFMLQTDEQAQPLKPE